MGNAVSKGVQKTATGAKAVGSYVKNNSGTFLLVGGVESAITVPLLLKSNESGTSPESDATTTDDASESSWGAIIMIGIVMIFFSSMSMSATMAIALGG